MCGPPSDREYVMRQSRIEYTIGDESVYDYLTDLRNRFGWTPELLLKEGVQPQDGRVKYPALEVQVRWPVASQGELPEWQYFTRRMVRIASPGDWAREMWDALYAFDRGYCIMVGINPKG
jgi:hypothetical protein